MAYKYPVKISGTDITGFIVPGSYTTNLIPVYSEAVTTMDGIDHVSLIRVKHSISFSLNPVPDDRMDPLFALLRSGTVSVEYVPLDSGTAQIGTFRLDEMSVSYLYGVVCQGKRWNSIQPLTLVEL